MYLRITRTHFDPTLAEQVAPLAREAVAAVQRLPGVQQVHQGIDRASGTGAIVSVWDSEAHARFSRDALGEVMARVAALGVQLDPPEIYAIEDDA
jgi:quinol monooxygenase YgiN